MLKKSFYLAPWAKEPLYRKFIRWLYVRFVKDMYIPDDVQISMTYGPNGRRGLKLARNYFGKTNHRWSGNEEKHFNMPEDTLEEK
jgi:hypothetical protein